MIKKVDHIGIAVKSLDQTLPFYTEELKMALLDAGGTHIELLEPTSPESAIAKYIEKRGEGIHHIALGVNSIQDRLNELREKGIRLIQEEAKVGAGESKVAFLHPKSASGVL